jgi:hypothetical protein
LQRCRRQAGSDPEFIPNARFRLSFSGDQSHTSK